MRTAASAPADLSTMGIIHSALRRDLARARLVLSGAPDAPRRAAIGEHLLWMMAWLHHHHEGEDAALWPELLRRDPGIAALLERMESDHAAIQGPMAELERVGRGLVDGSATTTEAIAALDALSGPLLPHLALEEADAMPEASRLLTQAEWDDLEQRTWSGNLTPPEMARLGLWVLDGLPPEKERVFLRIVPWWKTLGLRLVFTAPEARRRARLWGGTPAAGVKSLPAGADPAPPRRRWGFRPTMTRTAVVSATPAQVYAVLADPTRVGEWSHEAVGARWEGAAAPEPGARFVGSSRVGRLAWSVPCVVEVAEPGRRFGFRTAGQASTRWRYDLEPVIDGTRITQRYEVVSLPRWREVLLYLLIPSHRDRSDALAGDLVNLGRVAASESPAV